MCLKILLKVFILLTLGSTGLGSTTSINCSNGGMICIVQMPLSTMLCLSITPCIKFIPFSKAVQNPMLHASAIPFVSSLLCFKKGISWVPPVPPSFSTSLFSEDITARLIPRCVVVGALLEGPTIYLVTIRICLSRSSPSEATARLYAAEISSPEADVCAYSLIFATSSIFSRNSR